MNKHTAIAPDGTVLKRKSLNRVYPYVVAVRESFAYALAKAQVISAVDEQNFRYWAEKVAGNAFYAYETEEDKKKLRDLVRFYYDAEPDPDEAAALYARDCADERCEKVHEQRAAGRFDKYVAAGWSSRRDLAEKNAYGLNGFVYEDIVILETIVN